MKARPAHGRTRLASITFTLLALLLGNAGLYAQTEARAEQQRTGKNQEKPPEKEWRVVISRDVYTDYQRFIGQRDPLALKTFGGPYARRDVAELVLLQQALQRGGASRALIFRLTDSDSRGIKILRNGEADISGGSLWQSSVAAYEKELLISRAVIQPGHFMAGLYFPQDHPALKTLAKKPQDISRYTAVCANSWAPDLITLRALGSPVLTTENWESMLGMLKKKRGDYLLAPFQPTPDMRLETADMVLLPVAGIKVGLAGSRHFVLWRQGPDAAFLQAALERGLAALEKDGSLQRAYRESGFTHPATEHWPVLNR